MTKREKVALPCPGCHEKQEVELFVRVDLKSEPNLKYGILTDSIFTHTCTSCGKRFQISHELLVTDEEASYAILLAPSSTVEKVPAPEDFHGMTLRLVKDKDELKEKILILSDLLDDRTVELCKLYLAMREENPSALLRYSEHRDGKLRFAVFGDEGTVTHSLEIADSLYTELLGKGKGFKEEEDLFLYVDSLWILDRIEAANG